MAGASSAELDPAVAQYWVLLLSSEMWIVADANHLCAVDIMTSTGLEAPRSQHFCDVGFYLLNGDRSTDVKRNAFKTARCSGKSFSAHNYNDFILL